jgi:hypothetical protein
MMRGSKEMMKMKLAPLMMTASLLGACVADTDPVDEGSTQQAEQNELRPKHVHPVRGEARPPNHGGGGNGINYNGGPVMLGTTNIHYIWYGNWSGNQAVSILTDFAQNIGGSPYFNINTTYYNGSNTHVSNSVAYAGSVNDNYSRGTSLSDADIQTIVAASNPTDANGVYFVLTSADVSKSGMCTSYCGWHTHATIGGRDIKYSFVGDSSQCPANCQEQAVGPNGSSGGDGMASIVAHELEEAVTDPDLNAWYDRRGMENADKCAWTFGATYTSGGATANMQLGSRDYLIQQNWVNASGGFCAKSF